jgi:hypothetical protein
MHLVKRTERGWIVHCDCQGQAQFAVPPLGIAIECTRCGRTALAVDLVADYWSRSTAVARGRSEATAKSA